MGMNSLGGLALSPMRSFTNPNRGDDIAEYESALGSVRAEVCFWHLADILFCSLNVRFQGQSGHRVTL